MQRAATFLRITPSLLEEIKLLFESPRGGTLPNGFPDGGYNCFAKAFACVYLARLQGIAAEHCAGEAWVVWKREPRNLLHYMEPHAWAGVRPCHVIDLSISNLGGRDYFTTGHLSAGARQPVPSLLTTVPTEFAKTLTRVPVLPLGTYLFYYARTIRPFRFDDIQKGGATVNSLPTRTLAARHRKDILAKIVLHLHGLIAGERPPLGGTQADAWAQLGAWKVDAFARLEVIWRLAWRGRTAPPRESLEHASWQAQWKDVSRTVRTA